MNAPMPAGKAAIISGASRAAPLLLAGALCLPAAAQEGAKAATILLDAGAEKIVCTLNGSRAARDLLAQLPLEVEISDYAGKEKTFSPPRKLDTSDAPPDDGSAGSLAYFAPWNNVVLFYKDGGPFSGLYELGECASGATAIEKLRGRVTVSAHE